MPFLIDDGPFVLTALPTTGAEQLAVARTYLARKLANIEVLSPPPAARHDGRIRVAYLSADFRQHVVATVMALKEFYRYHTLTASQPMGSYGLVRVVSYGSSATERPDRRPRTAIHDSPAMLFGTGHDPVAE